LLAPRIEDAFANNHIIFGDNPLMRWYTNNVLVKTNGDGNKFLITSISKPSFKNKGRKRSIRKLSATTFVMPYFSRCSTNQPTTVLGSILCIQDPFVR
jgi:hypothetical protein